MGSMVFKTRTPVGGRYGFNVHSMYFYRGKWISQPVFILVLVWSVNFWPNVPNLMQTLEFDNLSKIVYHLLCWFGYYDIIIIFCDVWDSNHIFHNFSGKTNNDSRLQYFKDRIKSKSIWRTLLSRISASLNTSRYSGTAEPGWQVLAQQLTHGGQDLLS